MLNLWFEQKNTSDVDVRRVAVEEGISRLFSVSVHFASRDPDLALSAIVGRGAALRVAPEREQGASGSRTWGGVCCHVELVKVEPTGESVYAARIVPRLWALTQRRGYRIFQHLTVPEIARQVLSEWGVDHRPELVEEPYPRLHYKVQYDETDYAFLSRLLEEAGISFVVEDPPAGGTSAVVVLRDAPGGVAGGLTLPFVDNPNTTLGHDHVTDVGVSHEVRPGAYLLGDFDPRRPRMPVEASAGDADGAEAALGHHLHDPGSFLAEVPPDGSTPIADSLGAARALEPVGLRAAQRALEAERSGRVTVSFRTNVAELHPGALLTIDDHPHHDLAGRRLLVTSMSSHGPRDGKWHFSARAVFAEVPYRPPRKTPRPQALGMQSATVVGPPGMDIHTDELGRVHVQFPWDRKGTWNDLSTCWLRVSQGWAGAGYGMTALPRVGQEVLVGFLGGDPDQPIVVGRVHNGIHPTPYKLPENQTVSTWRTASSPYTGGFNEIRFEDRATQEEIFVHAQKDLRADVGNEDTTEAGQRIRAAIKPTSPLVTQWDMVNQRFTVTTGLATVTLVGPFLALEAEGDIEIRAKGNVVINGAKILLNCDKPG